MNSEDRHRRASEVFSRAVELPHEQRQPFIESECGNDTELLEEVLSLLAYDDGHSSFPESPLINITGGHEADVDDDTMIGTTVGRYRIEGKLGRGGMGVVWKASDPLLGRHVALKLIPAHLQTSPSARERFLRGARAASGLDHPGIATVYDAGDEDDDIYITMRLVDGRTLREILKDGPLSPKQSVRVGLAAAEALAFAHDHGVVHRDVTSNNIMIGTNGDVFVVDFGLALGPGAARLSSGGHAAGTVAYMAPELLSGEDGDARSDIFALGVVLYEVITGTLPFTGRTQAGVIKGIMHDAPVPVRKHRSDVSATIEQIILRALSKDPAERYQTAGTLAADLRTAMRAIDPDFEPHTRQHTMRSRVARIAIPLALAAAAVSVALLLSRKPSDEHVPADAGITTTSIDAYRHYLEGEDSRHRWDLTNANISYRRALSYDSAFAMAYMRLTRWGTPAEKHEAIEKALRYADGVTAREQGLIRARAAVLSSDTDRAIAELDGVIAAFPDDKDAYIERARIYQNFDTRKQIRDLNRALAIDATDRAALCFLAYAYQVIGEPDSCLLISDRYVELAPDEPNPYDTRGELLAKMGRLDEAITAYEKGLSIAPDFSFSLEYLGVLYLLTKRFDKARELYTRFVSTGDPGQRSTGRMYLAFIPLYQGKLNEAADALDKGLAADEMGGYDGWAYRWKLYHRASIHAEKKEWEQCLERSKTLIAHLQARAAGHTGWHWAYISFLARMKNFAEADNELDVVRRAVADTTNANQMVSYWQSKANIERERGNFVAARDAMDHIGRPSWDIWNRYEYSLSCLSAGRVPDAIEQLETIVRIPQENKIFNVLRGARATYYLGVAYEASGRLEEAAEQYKQFLSLWKDADPGIDNLKDARTRLAALQGQRPITSTR